MKYGPFLKSFTLENFKAIQKSGAVSFTPLTVLIGNNGSGKSSLIEGLETYRSIVMDGLDTAMQRWYGFEHIWNKRVRHRTIGFGLNGNTHENPIKFEINGRFRQESFQAKMAINARPGLNGYFIQEETGKISEGLTFKRDFNGKCQTQYGVGRLGKIRNVESGESALPEGLKAFVSRWQFLNLMPDPMGRPEAKTMTGNGKVMLNRDGSNLAQYLLNIREKDPAVFNGIVESMQFVLEYIRNIEPVDTREIMPTMYLKMWEQLGEKKMEIPGWLISTGTIRILALLAVLRNPEPPPLIVMEEIENGLDPRTLHLILEEIQTMVHGGKSQIILTTHSPYFLDLLPLQTILLAERDETGNPVFRRPADDKEVRNWAEKFAPGRLYTTGRLSRGK
ncbi:MAG: ATP-binding protein [Thermodesulfobacteriota bacterium]